MKDKTHLTVAGEGVYIEDSHGREQKLVAEKHGYHKIKTGDGYVEVFVMPNTTNFPGKFRLDFFAPRKVNIVRQELV